MTRLDELLDLAARTDGPDAATTDADRARFVSAMARKPRRRWRRRVVFPVAVALLAGGVGAAAAGGLFHFPDHGTIQGSRVKAAFPLGHGERLELLGGITPTPEKDCPSLRIASGPAKPADGTVCFLLQHEDVVDGLSAHASPLPRDLVAVYGRIPDRASKVVVRFGTAAVTAAGSEGWYVAAGPAGPRITVSAFDDDNTIATTDPAPPPALPGPADCPAAAALPIVRPDSKPNLTDEMAQFSRRNTALVQIRDLPDGYWALYVSRRGSRITLDRTAFAADGSPGGGGGTTFAANDRGIGLSTGSLVGPYFAADRSAPNEAVCAVVTDGLGRRYATMTSTTPLVPEFKLWSVAYISDTDVARIDFYDAAGHRITRQRARS